MNVAAVLDGEHCGIWLPVILSMTDSEMPEAAAPMMASTSSLMSWSTAVEATSGEVPESVLTNVTLPPAALISSTAISIGFSSASMMTARSPVWGSSVPMVSSTGTISIGGSAVVVVSSASVVVVSSAAVVVVSAASPSVVVVSSPSPPPHAAATRARAVSSATRRSMCFMGSFLLCH